MTIYPERRYYFSKEARDNLALLFTDYHPGSKTRTGMMDIDGNLIVDKRSHISTGDHSISNSLNVLANLVLIDHWLDTRTPEQIQICEAQTEPPPPFHSLKEAKAYKQSIGGYDQYKALWTPLTPYDLDPNRKDKDNNYIPYLKHEVLLRLSPDAINYYCKLANKYKMRVLSRISHASKTGYISACLEAIGQHYLSPPPYYKRFLRLFPNQNYGGHSTVALRKRQPTNLDRMSKPFNWKPITVSNAATYADEIKEHFDSNPKGG